MSIDFSKVTALSDQYGNIVEVTDEAGNVLWKQAPSGATVNITVSSGYEKDILLIDGVYYGKEATTLTVPIGTVIATKGATQVVIRNSAGSTPIQGDYNYTVTGDVGVHVSGTKPNPYFTVYVVTIVEQ